MPTFRKGDRVVLTKDDSGVKAGTTGTVLADQGFFDSLSVAFEGKGEKKVNKNNLQRM